MEERLALLEIGRGDFDTAQRRLERLRGITSGILAPSRIAPLALGLAEHALALGDPMAARDALADGIQRIGAATDPWVGSIGPLLATRVRAEAAIASSAVGPGSAKVVDEARSAGARSLEQMRAMADEIAANRPAYSPQAAAWLATCEAEHAALLGRDDPDRWATAVGAWRALGMRVEEALALAREGQAALAGRDRRRAAQMLGSARALAVELGARPLLAQIDDLLGRAGIRPEMATERAIAERPTRVFGDDSGQSRLGGRDRGGGFQRGPDDLTPRELETLGLVAAGLTDGEIAATLFISKKTASVHVAHIKDKLGATSRVDIVRSAQILGLIEPVSPDPRRSQARPPALHWRRPEPRAPCPSPTRGVALPVTEPSPGPRVTRSRTAAWGRRRADRDAWRSPAAGRRSHSGRRVSAAGRVPGQRRPGPAVPRRPALPRRAARGRWASAGSSGPAPTLGPGATVYTIAAVNLQVTLPPGWVGFDATTPAAAIRDAIAEHPELEEALNLLESGIGFVAVDAAATGAGQPTSMTVSSTGSAISSPAVLESLAQTTASQVEATQPIDGEVTSSTLQLATGPAVNLVWQLEPEEGAEPLGLDAYLLPVGERTFAVTFAAPVSVRDGFQPAFRAIVESMRPV